MSRGVELDTSEEVFGFLNEFTDDPIENIDAAKAAYEKDGYLYVKGFWNRQDVMACREEIADALVKLNLLDPQQPPMAAFLHPDNLQGIGDSSKGSATIDGVANESQLIKAHLYSGKTIAFYEAFLGHEVNHFDNVWLRAMAPGFGTVPHSDRVFMGGGTDNVMVCWHPYGDIDIRTGGLIVLDSTAPGTENEKKRELYWSSDVDEYCSNEPFPEHVDLEATSDNKVWNGALSDDPANLQAELGGRWLTSPNFEMGDLLTISLKHGSCIVRYPE